MRVDSKTPLIVPTPHLDPLPLPKGRGENARERLHRFDVPRPGTRYSQPTTSCGWKDPKTLQIVCFSLVTLARLLY